MLFDLLTALLDSWTAWNRVAGDEQTGRRWRTEYLRLTYGCGEYQPYESLVRIAAQRTGLPISAAAALEEAWQGIEPWPDAPGLLHGLAKNHRLGIVTNCSERLGRAAAKRLGLSFEVLVTAERAGFYKPDAAPYRLALTELDLSPREVLFVAGSGFDLIGTARVGLDTYWHNRVGLERPSGAPAPLRESRTLEGLFQ